MLAYLVRRLLVMIPTFFGISLVVFLVLNLAPGRPGAQQAGGQAADQQSQATQESYRIFREQFGLDRPTLLNTRFALEEGQVRIWLQLLGRTDASPADRIEAQQQLEDVGRFALPHLIRIIEAPSTAVGLRDRAVNLLSINARRPLVDPFDRYGDPEVRAADRQAERANAQFRRWRYAADAPEADKQEVIGKWVAWFKLEGLDRGYTTGEKLRILLFETRFARYWSNLLRLDFGVSLSTKKPVLETLRSKLKYSLVLSIGSLLLAYLIAIPLGVFSAVRRGSRADRVVTLALFMLYSLPSFFVATLLLLFLSKGSSVEALRVFPTGGWSSSDPSHTTVEQIGDILWHIALPLVCMTYGSLAAISRYMRSGLLEVIGADYIRTAYAKGLTESAVIGKHALRNGLLPILTLLSGLLPAVLGGSVIIEYIFGIPGMGMWVVEAIHQRDYNVIMGVQLLSTILVLLGILLTDLSYAWADPRIRYS